MTFLLRSEEPLSHSQVEIERENLQRLLEPLQVISIKALQYIARQNAYYEMNHLVGMYFIALFDPVWQLTRVRLLLPVPRPTVSPVGSEVYYSCDVS